MEIRPIRTDDDHAEAVREIARLWQAEAGSPDADRLAVLATLVDVYETRRWPTAALSPIEMIRHAMEDQGRTQQDLAALLGGSRSRASEVLSGRRPLSVWMIHALHQAWGIPAEALTAPYAVSPRPGKARAGAAG
ncbi:transcriptional regulator [Allostella vacuolata]|nr:transcriptional regulator [Stella vacuolata]